MILVVFVAVMADLSLAAASENMDLGFAWPGVVFPLVLTWYIITEIGPILENAARMGAPVPKWLIKLMTVSRKAVEALGGTSTGEQEPPKVPEEELIE